MKVFFRIITFYKINDVDYVPNGCLGLIFWFLVLGIIAFLTS